MSTERGIAIQEAVRAMGEERYLRQLAQQRDKRMAQKKRKIESSSAALDAEKERKEALKEYQKEWRSKNKDKVKEYNRRYRQKKKAGVLSQHASDVLIMEDCKNRDVFAGERKPVGFLQKEADATAIATTSDGFTDQKPLNDYTKETEECQPSQSTKSTALPEGEPDCGVDSESEVTGGAFYEYDTPGDTSGREIRQQRRAELPVHLL